MSERQKTPRGGDDNENSLYGEEGAQSRPARTSSSARNGSGALRSQEHSAARRQAGGRTARTAAPSQKPKADPYERAALYFRSGNLYRAVGLALAGLILFIIGISAKLGLFTWAGILAFAAGAAWAGAVG